MPRGLLIVFTGDGKGKTTAALGMALRAAGHGMKTLILQFIKGAWSYGELKCIERIDEITIRQLGTGFTWKKDNLDEDRRLAESGWVQSVEAIRNGGFDMIILDELNLVLHYGLLDPGPVLDTIQGRPAHLHIVVTGRNAPEALVECADLVTEMVAVKHPYHDQGIGAQKGIEF